MATAQEPGLARSPGLSYQELLDADTHEVPKVLREQSPRFLGDEDVSIDRYISREWFEREKERLWGRVWQFACREEHIPRPGDYTLYEIVGKSFLVVPGRRDDDQGLPQRLPPPRPPAEAVRRPLRGDPVPVPRLRLELDGSLKDVPAAWDLPHVDAGELRACPRCKVGTWAGFVFINPDPDAEPLEDFIGELADHFERWDLTDRYVQAHVAKEIRANWKIAQEAFCEAFHVNATHPQILPYIGDTNSQVDVWDTFSRVITPGGHAEPAARLDARRGGRSCATMLDVRVDEELFDHHQGGPDGPVGDGRRHP